MENPKGLFITRDVGNARALKNVLIEERTGCNYFNTTIELIFVPFDKREPVVTLSNCWNCRHYMQGNECPGHNELLQGLTEDEKDLAWEQQQESDSGCYNFKPNDFLEKNLPGDIQVFYYAKDGNIRLANELALKELLSEPDYKKMPYKEYLQTDHWKNFREKAYEKFNYKCVLCDSGTRLNLHHKTYKNLGNETFDDVVLLCQKCHHWHHEGGK